MAPSPPPSSSAAVSATSNPASSSSEIHTYHCAGCSALLLGISQSLDSLGARGQPVIDGARILPLSAGAAATTTTTTESVPVSKFPGLKRDGGPMVVQRSDGYENRWQWRCTRCRTVAGYTLLEGPEEARKEDEDGRVGYAVFLLETSLVSSEDLEKLVEKERRAART